MSRRANRGDSKVDLLLILVILAGFGLGIVFIQRKHERVEQAFDYACTMADGHVATIQGKRLCLKSWAQIEVKP